jgi:hypothetical protein
MMKHEPVSETELLSKLKSIVGNNRFSYKELSSAKDIPKCDLFSLDKGGSFLKYNLLFSLPEFQLLYKIFPKSELYHEDSYSHAIIIQLCLGLQNLGLQSLELYKSLYFDFLEILLSKKSVAAICIALQFSVFW